MKSILHKISAVLSIVENAIVLSSLVLMFLTILLQIGMRYLFHAPLLWSEEVARYLFVYFTFIGMSFGIRENTHIRMVTVVNLLPQKAQEVLMIVCDLLLAVLFFWLAPQCLPFLKTQVTVYATATHIPMMWIFLALPIGLIMSGIRMIINCLQKMLPPSSLEEEQE